MGAVDTLAVDMAAVVPASSLTLARWCSRTRCSSVVPGHDALEEIARRALATGARVLALRSADLPDGVQAAGILRYAFISGRATN
jgi:hypothetical protein